MSYKLLLFTFLLTIQPVFSQDVDSLDLMDSSDVNVLLEEEKGKIESQNLDLSDLEEQDDLQTLKNDIGDVIFDDDPKKKKKEQGILEEKVSNELDELDKIEEEPEIVIDSKNSEIKILNDQETVANQDGDVLKEEGTEIFDVGPEEKELLELSKFVEGKIPENEWDEISTAAKLEKYIIQEGDWLWRISQKLFGSGFYYSKIWSLNPHITNPHEIEPGMVLVFDTGTEDSMPKVKVGDFDSEIAELKRNQAKSKNYFDFQEFGEGVKPPWIDERKKLLDQGVYFQYISDETYDDLAEIGKLALRDEYQKYDPPIADIIIQEPGDQYDDSGFDKNSKIIFNIKEGFFLNTFVTSNIVQDLGVVEAAQKDGTFLQLYDRIYLKFGANVKVKPGDQFSIYSADGKVTHSVSDRAGFRYTIVAQVKTVRKQNHLWESEITALTGIAQRSDRITIFTPKISKITQTFNKRNIEAAIIGSFVPTSGGMAFGDVVYIDRGRADGVEMGTVFELFSFKDRNTEKKITPDPTYRVGELTVITLTDNFSTCLITQSTNEVGLGTIAVSKTAEQAALASRIRKGDVFANIKTLEGKALDELDVELNLDDISEDILDQADQVKLTEDELEELERQERERSIIKDHERDLRELEKLEQEIVQAEQALNEAKVDEDKFLEQQNLNEIEKRAKNQDPDAFESLNDIEKEIGRKYLDEDINAKENPYGLTEFDLEEIDELLNTERL